MWAFISKSILKTNYQVKFLIIEKEDYKDFYLVFPLFVFSIKLKTTKQLLLNNRNHLKYPNLLYSKTSDGFFIMF